MKCREYANQLIKDGWKVINREGGKLTLSKNNQQKIIIDLRFDTSVKGAGTGSGSFWVNPANIVSSNDAYATFGIGTSSPSDPLYAYQFGFAVSGDITNILVKIERKASTSGYLYDDIVKIGTYGGTFYTNKASATFYTTSDVTASYNFTPTDWGWAGVTAANINNANFAVLFQAYNSSGFERTVYVDYIEVTITYTPAPTSLVIAEMLHSQAIDNIALIQNLTLVINELLHSQTIENLILIENKLLAIQELLHSQTIDTFNLPQVHNLTVQEMLHSQSIDNLILIQNLTLEINELLHSQGIESINLIQQFILTISDVLHSQKIDSLDLIQNFILVINNLLHSQNVDNLTLTRGFLLVIQEILHSQGIDIIDLIIRWKERLDELKEWTEKSVESGVWTEKPVLPGEWNEKPVTPGTWIEKIFENQKWKDKE